MPRIELLLAAVILLMHLYPALSPPNSLVNWYTTDDAYYYFKVAQNIAEGYGSTFDRIGLTNGYHPLWMLVCIPIFSLARFDLLLPMRVVIIVLAILNALTGIILFRLAKQWLSPGIAALVAFFWTLFPDIHSVTTTLGMESGLNAFFAALLLYKAASLFKNEGGRRNHPRNFLHLGVIAALLLLSRLDSAFIIGMFAIWIIFTDRHIRFIMVGDLLILLLAVFGAFIIRLKLPLYYYYSTSAMFLLVIVVVFQFGISYLLGLYRPVRLPLKQLLTRTALAYLLTSCSVSALMLGLLSTGIFDRFPRLVLALEFLLAILPGLGWRIWNNSKFQVTDSQSPEIKQTFTKDAFRNGVYYLLPVVVTLLTYMIVNYFVFGTPSPVSGQVKRWWATIMTVYGKPETTLTGILGLTPNPDLSPWALIVRIPHTIGDLTVRYGLATEQNHPFIIIVSAVVLLVLVIAILRPNRMLAGKAFEEWNLLPFFAGCVLQTTAYKMSGYVSLHAWYWVPEMLFIVLCGGIILDGFYRGFVIRILNETSRQAVGVVMVVALMGSNFWWMNALTPWKVPEGQEEGYLWGARGLEASTSEGSLIGSTGGGVLAYFTRGRTIINMDGLISSYDYFDMLRSGRGAEYFDRIGLDYVYAGEWVLIYSEPYTEIFKGRLKYIDTIVYTNLYQYLSGK